MGTIQGNAKPKRDRRKRERDPSSAGNDDDSAIDPRFIAAETDPRFGRVPKRAKKAVVDNRFKQTLKQNPGFRDSDTPVDRFGRPKRAQRLHGSVRDVIAEDDESASESDEDIDDGDRPDATSAFDDESDSDDSDIAEFVEEEAEQLEDIPRGKATRRLAVIGLDWSTTRSVDIYACLESFCPPGKSVKSVEVHPSKFGLERLAAEAKFGPQVIAKGDMKVIEDAQKQNVADKSGRTNTTDKTGMSEKEDDDELDSELGDGISDSDDEGVEEKRWKEQAALRKYEEERLKYYYAVVEFEDVKAADAVYEQCDGVEYAQSGRAFDLRFIPDDMEIETTPRDRAESVPDGYIPPNVAPSSLNSSTVKLSWDADDPDRVILKKKAIGKQELDEENLKAYLGSASEAEEEESTADIEKKRNLLLGSDQQEAEEEPNMGMEITFEPGMLEKAEEIVKRKKAKDERQGETHWEARLRRLQERKTEKRRKRREELDALRANGDVASGSDEETADNNGKNNDSSGFADPFFHHERKIDNEEPHRNGKKRGSNRRTTSPEEETKSSSDSKEEARKRAELELLVMDDAAGNAKSAGSMRDMLAAAESDDDDDRSRSRGGKRSSGRRRRRRDKEQKKESTESSTMDIKDPRFQGLFNSHLFAMDPTHPKFRDNETTQRILREKMRRTKRSMGAQDEPKHATENGRNESSQRQEQNVEKGNTAGSELRQLAARLKARAKTSGKKNRQR